MRKTFMAILVLVMLFTIPVFARSTYYATGDQVFTFRAGVDFPTFISFYNQDFKTVTFDDTHMKLGGYASISYQGYMNSRFALGGELGYAFNYSRSMDLLTTVPITAKLTFVPVQTGTLDIAASLNLGVAFIRYNEGKYMVPYAQATIQPSIFITESWGLGVEWGIMTTAEIYPKNDKNNRWDKSAFCGLMPLTLALSYRH